MWSVGGTRGQTAFQGLVTMTNVCLWVYEGKSEGHAGASLTINPPLGQCAVGETVYTGVEQFIYSVGGCHRDQLHHWRPRLL